MKVMLDEPLSAMKVSMRVILAALFVVLAFHGVVHAQPGREPAPDPGTRAQPYAPPAQPYPAQPYAAQPGQPYPPAPPYPAQPYPPPGPYPPSGQYPPAGQYPPPAGAALGVVPPYQYVELTLDEQKLLARGEISDNRYIGGAVASIFFGFGVGQAVQGRYGDTGWIFTVGEVGSLTALFVGLLQSFDRCYYDAYEPSCSDDNHGETLLIGGMVGLLVFRAWELVDAFAGPPKHNARVRELRLRLGMPPPMYSRRLAPYVAPTMSRDGGGTAGLTLRF